MSAGEARPAFGRPRLHLRSTGSTNDVCRELATAGAPSGTIVTAEEQTAGRGRRGRAWLTRPGEALLCSALLRDLGERDALLALAVPLAVCEALEELGVGGAEVKWPNDVWLSNRKLAGILIEARPPDWAVIGVGVNASGASAAPSDRWAAGSAGVAPERLLPELCSALDRLVADPPPDLRERFAARDMLAGRTVEWEGHGGGTGVARGIDATGSLRVERDDGTEALLSAGEVTLSSVG
ncbi:biotin--[acetyl-CoA-carboxylase] ligase [Thermoleophilia bacterium SCSIO 60948]|nr:biotin--[acetyl-CoA-carboxylase] ligase [Thermoleophilia bacterium SCSIO 60948]